MDSHERLGPNQSAKIEAECLTTAQSTAKMQVRSGSKSLSVDALANEIAAQAKAEAEAIIATAKQQAKQIEDEATAEASSSLSVEEPGTISADSRRP